MCTANPYPILMIGDGNDMKKQIKRFDDRESAMDAELNPQFLKAYEFDNKLPKDSKLEI